jgi:hypothetical protein
MCKTEETELSDQPIYINYSEDVRQALAAADVDMAELIRDELKKENIDAEVSLVADPRHPNSTDREVFLLILASGVAVSLVGSAVARVIDAVTKRERASMVEQEIKVATGSDGQTLLDKEGNPLHNTTSKPTAFPSPGKEETSFTAFKLLTYKFFRS